MKLVLNPDVQQFIDKLQQKLTKHDYDVNDFYFHGGCIRDYFFGVKPNDYDIYTEHKVKKLHKILGGEYNPEKKWIIFRINDDIVQLSQGKHKLVDFTINSFHASLNGQILSCEQCKNDLMGGWLRMINPLDSTCLFRGIYMIYKHPHLQFTPSTLSNLRKLKYDHSSVENRIVNKNIDRIKFYEIARKFNLYKNLTSNHL